MNTLIIRNVWIVLFLGVLGCAEPLTTRETGAVVGTLGGAAVGGIIGSAVGHPGAGAAVGGAIGLGAGALIGDQIQALQKRQSEMDKQIQASQAELESQRRELERLKKEDEVPQAESRFTRTPPAIIITEGKTAQGFRYLHGGVGSDEREMMEKKEAAYNVKLSFAAKGGPLSLRRVAGDSRREKRRTDLAHHRRAAVLHSTTAGDVHRERDV